MKLDAPLTNHLKCLNMKKLTVAMFAVLMLIAARAGAQDFTVLNQELEIRSYPGEGYFQYIHAAALDETDNTVTLLAGPALGLYTFSVSSGAALKYIPIEEAISPPVVMWRCGGPTVILSHTGFLAYGDDGRPIADFKPPAHMPDALSKVLCTHTGNLVFFDDVNKRIHNVGPDGELKYAIGADPEAKNPRDQILRSLLDGAVDAVGELYVLDAKQGEVKKFSHRGEFRRVVVRSSGFSDSVHLSRPMLLSVDALSNIWIYDQGDLSLKAYDDFGFLKYYVTNTGANGFLFQDPQWITIDRTNRLLILDRGATALRVFDLNQLN